MDSEGLLLTQTIVATPEWCSLLVSLVQQDKLSLPRGQENGSTLLLHFEVNTKPRASYSIDLQCIVYL